MHIAQRPPPLKRESELLRRIALPIGQHFGISIGGDDGGCELSVDVVELEVDGLGVLSNTIVQEDDDFSLLAIKKS